MVFGSYESSERGRFATALMFLLIGFGAGAAVALLFAPRSGKELRRDLRRKYEDAIDAVEDFTDEAKGRVDEVLERGAEIAEDIKKSARQTMGPLGRAMRKR